MAMRLGWRNRLTTHLVDIDAKVTEGTLQIALCRAGVRLGPPTEASVDCVICNTRSQRSLLTQSE